MVSDLPYTYYNTARDAAEEFFGSAPLEVFEDNKDHIVDAHFLSEVSEGTKTCSLRVVMSKPWVVRSLLRDAHLLKTKGCMLYRKTYVKPDRTFQEQQQHRLLVAELKDKIKSDSKTKWIIKSGKVQPGGVYPS